MKTHLNIENILQHYAVAALWSSNDNSDDSGGDPLDDNYDLSDIAPETMQAMREDVAEFVSANEALLIESGQSEEMIGHDFWLTRNGYGAGFWDRGLGDIGDKLTTACKAFPEVDLYVGDDGQVWS